MNKQVCFLHTEASPIHNCIDEEITKKDLFKLGRMLNLKYMVGDYKNYKFYETKSFSSSIKHAWEDLESKPHDIILDLKSHIKNVKIIIGYDINYHIKSIVSEAIRYNIYIDFVKYILIDLKTFNHTYDTKTIEELYIILNTKSDVMLDEIHMLIYCFNKLYMKLVKSKMSTE